MLGQVRQPSERALWQVSHEAWHSTHSVEVFEVLTNMAGAAGQLSKQDPPYLKGRLLDDTHERHESAPPAEQVAHSEWHGEQRLPSA